MAVIVGDGTTLVFGTSAFAGELLAINSIGGIEREAIDITPLSVVAPGAGKIGNAVALPSNTVGPITLELRFFFDPDLTPPIHENAETITITFPLPAGASTPATWVASGFMTSYNPEGLERGTRVEAVATITVTGAVTLTASA